MAGSRRPDHLRARDRGAAATERAARRRAAVAPHFGPYYAWYVGQCAAWPGPAPDRYLGPWRRAARPGGLVVGMRYDPVADYAGVARFARLIDGGLLTVTDGRGHLSLGQSDCARLAVSAYLVTARRPADAIACTADRQPF
ncbi:alpha/beta hydrolase [Plantactinospora siamensis]|uniref:Alpha/beta hydrolase n=1 Tax=Plantactinospora siamensis TaxID=555372 RepID=A0ABV6P4J6_9ACTN